MKTDVRNVVAVLMLLSLTTVGKAWGLASTPNEKFITGTMSDKLYEEFAEFDKDKQNEIFRSLQGRLDTAREVCNGVSEIWEKANSALADLENRISSPEKLAELKVELEKNSADLKKEIAGLKDKAEGQKVRAARVELAKIRNLEAPKAATEALAVKIPTHLAVDEKAVELADADLKAKKQVLADLEGKTETIAQNLDAAQKARPELEDGTGAMARVRNGFREATLSFQLQTASKAKTDHEAALAAAQKAVLEAEKVLKDAKEKKTVAVPVVEIPSGEKEKSIATPESTLNAVIAAISKESGVEESKIRASIKAIRDTKTTGAASDLDNWVKNPVWKGEHIAKLVTILQAPPKGSFFSDVDKAVFDKVAVDRKDEEISSSDLTKVAELTAKVKGTGLWDDSAIEKLVEGLNKGAEQVKSLEERSKANEELLTAVRNSIGFKPTKDHPVSPIVTHITGQRKDVGTQFNDKEAKCAEAEKLSNRESLLMMAQNGDDYDHASGKKARKNKRVSKSFTPSEFAKCIRDSELDVTNPKNKERRKAFNGKQLETIDALQKQIENLSMAVAQIAARVTGIEKMVALTDAVVAAGREGRAAYEAAGPDHKTRMAKLTSDQSDLNQKITGMSNQRQVAAGRCQEDGAAMAKNGQQGMPDSCRQVEDLDRQIGEAKIALAKVQAGLAYGQAKGDDGALTPQSLEAQIGKRFLEYALGKDGNGNGLAALFGQNGGNNLPGLFNGGSVRGMSGGAYRGMRPYQRGAGRGRNAVTGTLRPASDRTSARGTRGTLRNLGSRTDRAGRVTARTASNSGRTVRR